ncbi:MAG: cupin domain-containing protein [Alphaproteobacteria bacterium]|jgi:uncharacterized cupin superfamily protein
MQVIRLSPAPLADADRSPVDAAKVLDGTPDQAFDVVYTSQSGELSAGIYECSAGKWRVSYSEDEFCTLTEGTVRITDADGQTTEFRAPDSFMIPAGFNGTWEAVTPVRKFFVIYEKTV